VEPLQFEIKLGRSVSMVRPEEGTLKLVLKPTAAFLALSAEQQVEYVETAKSETHFRCSQRNQIRFLGWGGLNEFFEIEIEAERWEYKGGECIVTMTSYELTAERVK
jgi:hypothetical protein